MSALLALDFDGVISDSAPEAFVVALRTYLGLRPESRLRDPAAPLLEGDAPAPVRVVESPLYPPFLEAMPLGNRAEDYAVMLGAFESEAPLSDQAAYDAFRDGLDPAWLRAFHKEFYRVRTALSKRDPEGWHSLMGPYPRVVDLLRRRAGDLLLAIATAKDHRSVGALLERYGIADLFGAGLVLDKETGVSKAAHLEQLHREFGVDFEAITFVDDKVNHLDAVAHLGVRCALAAWGYNGPRESRQAQERGYLVCTLDSAEAQLFG